MFEPLINTLSEKETVRLMRFIRWEERASQLTNKTQKETRIAKAVAFEEDSVASGVEIGWGVLMLACVIDSRALHLFPSLEGSPQMD